MCPHHSCIVRYRACCTPILHECLAFRSRRSKPGILLLPSPPPAGSCSWCNPRDLDREHVINTSLPHRGHYRAQWVIRNHSPVVILFTLIDGLQTRTEPPPKPHAPLNCEMMQRNIQKKDRCPLLFWVGMVYLESNGLTPFQILAMPNVSSSYPFPTFMNPASFTI